MVFPQLIPFPLTLKHSKIPADDRPRHKPLWLAQLCCLLGVLMVCAGAYASAAATVDAVAPVVAAGAAEILLGLLLLINLMAISKWLLVAFLVLDLGLCLLSLYLWAMLVHFEYHEWPLPLWETAYRLGLPLTLKLVEAQTGEWS